MEIVKDVNENATTTMVQKKSSVPITIVTGFLGSGKTTLLKELLLKIHNLKKEENLAILWTTHLVDEAEKADKIIILNKVKYWLPPSESGREN